MAALVQTITAQQTPQTLLLQSQPPAPSLPPVAAGQSLQSHMSQNHMSPRSTSNGYSSSSNSVPANNNSAQGAYRYTSSAPIAPYAFTSTPTLNNNNSPNNSNKTTQGQKVQQTAVQQPQQQQQQQQKPNNVDFSIRQRTASDSISSSASSIISEPSPRQYVAQNQISLNRPQSQGSQPIPHVPSAQPSRPSPDRYRRPNRKAENAAPASSPLSRNGSAQPSGSGMAAVSAVYQQPVRSSSSPALPTATAAANSYKTASTQQVSEHFALGNKPIPPFTDQGRSQSADDIHTYRKPEITAEHHSHNRRRSFAAFGTGGLQALADIESKQARRASLQAVAMNSNGTVVASPPQATSLNNNNNNNNNTVLQPRFQAPQPAYARRGSSSSVSSNGSAGSRAVSSGKTEANNVHGPGPVQVPARGSSADANRRVANPSPLSKPVEMTPDPNKYQEFPQPGPSSTDKSEPVIRPLPRANTSAQERLAAISNDSKKSLKNRLRRALSFGSAAELRKVAANNGQAAKNMRPNIEDELDEEQQRIARQQEATGLGEGIYSGQGNFFGGSTDNVSVSSTASSASVMLRKMGKGMKKSTRSLVGLFRPKSAIGLSTAASSASTADASSGVAIVNVEAERRNVNVNIDPRDQAGGGTGFPRLERNSIDAKNASRGSDGATLSVREEDIRPRGGSFVGSEVDHQEAVATIKKGILKRTGSASPIVKPADKSAAEFQIGNIPQFSPNSPNMGPASAPPREGDFFMEPPQLPAAMASSSSVPVSPKNHPKYGVQFSPRITFHDTWHAGDYDRKGDIATCNRLTPMLAQQIKEELNTFKMEMDVHEDSRVYTHFF